MHAWASVALVCCLALGCGGPLEEVAPAGQPSQEQVSAQWSTPKLGKAYLVEDIFPDVPPSPPVSGPRPTEPTAFRGKVFFAANTPPLEEGESGSLALWRSDGTASGTRPVWERTTTSPLGQLEKLTATGGRLFFFVTEANSYELWVTDGTAGGTRQLSGSTPGRLIDVAAVGDTLFFIRSQFSPDTDWHYELWRSDGTPGGTIRLRVLEDFVTGLTALDGKLLFTARTAAHGWEPWVSDGTVGGTRLLKDIYPGSLGSQPEHLVPGDGVVYFAASDPEHGHEMWKTDGTLEGTVLVEDTHPGPRSAAARPLAVRECYLYFATIVRREEEHQGLLQLRKLKVSPHSARSRSVALKEIPNPVEPDEAPSAMSAVATRDRVYIVVLVFGDAALLDTQLWGTDGTRHGTQLLHRPLVTDTETPFPTFAPVDDRRVVFSALDDEHGQELWVSDGTSKGTRLLQDVMPGPGSSYPHDFVRVGSRVFFVANDGTTGYELWALPLHKQDR